MELRGLRLWRDSVSGTASLFSTSGQTLARVSVSSGIRVDRDLSRIGLCGTVKGHGAREDPLPPQDLSGGVWTWDAPWDPETPARGAGARNHHSPPCPCPESLEGRWETVDLTPYSCYQTQAFHDNHVFILETFSTSGYSERSYTFP